MDTSSPSGSSATQSSTVQPNRSILSQVQTNVDTTTCDVSKACFLNGCSGTSCKYVLTWAPGTGGLTVVFEMEAAVSSTNSWVAFGLSTDKKMGSDSVIECVYNSQTSAVEVHVSWNNGHNNQLSSTAQLSLVSGSTSGAYINGRITCRFEREISVSGSSSQGRRKRQTSSITVYPLDSASYYILMALGPASSGSMLQHSAATVSSAAVNITAYTSAVGSAADTRKNLTKAHGILMVLAWMIFASFGMLMPRYCKSAWPDKTWGGKKIWFQIHQPCMIITLILTALGFILIFAAVKDYSTVDSKCVAHPPLGIIVMILVLANPIMSVFRCDPGDKKRPIFNISHFLVGLLAHLAAVVTIFLGLYMSQLNLPLWTKGVMAAFICFHVAVEVTLAVHMHRLKIFGSGRQSSDIPMEPGAVENKQQQPKTSSSSSFLTAVLGVHLVVVTALAIAISVRIGAP